MENIKEMKNMMQIGREDIQVPKRMYSVRQLADIFDVSHWTIRNYIKDGWLRAYKIGGSIRISEESIEDFLNDSEIVVDEEWEE